MDDNLEDVVHSILQELKEKNSATIWNPFPDEFIQVFLPCWTNPQKHVILLTLKFDNIIQYELSLVTMGSEKLNNKTYRRNTAINGTELASKIRKYQTEILEDLQ
jgi:hypothetical protein